MTIKTDVEQTGLAYVPPKVWTWEQGNGGEWSGINRPTAGSREEKTLPRGEHPFQLYSMGTPNGQKVTILFEELIERGVTEAEYDAWLINIAEQDQFGSDFVDINPNSKIPALIDFSGETPTRVFESGAILLYLAEKFGQFLPKDIQNRTETLNWLFWLQGSAPSVGGGFGHFYFYAPEKIEYAIDRFTMETRRLLHVLERQLQKTPYVAGDEYTIADIAIWPWFGGIVDGRMYEATEFLNVDEYPHVQAWQQKIAERPAVQRGRRVNRFWGEESEQLKERHSADDFR